MVLMHFKSGNSVTFTCDNIEVIDSVDNSIACVTVEGPGETYPSYICYKQIECIVVTEQNACKI